MSKLALGKAAMIVTAFVLVFSILAGCTKSNGSKDEGTTASSSSTESAALSVQPSTQSDNTAGSESWKKYKDQPITLNWFVDDTLAIPEDNLVFQKIKEETGVTLKAVGAGDATHSQLNLMIASNGLPDLISVSGSIPQYKQMIQGGLLSSVSQLSAQYAPDVVNNMSDNVKKSLNLESDSKDIYAVMGLGDIPKGEENNPIIAKNQQVFAVEKNIYEALGSPKIATPDDLINVLRQVKEKYPDLIPYQSIRGQKIDGFGLPAAFWAIYPNFGLTPGFFKGDKGYYSLIEHENFPKMLKFVNTLYNEKLMSRTEFTDPDAKLFSNMQSGKVFADGRDDAPNLAWHNTVIASVKKNFEYEAIDPFVVEGSQYAFDEFNGGLGSYRTLISKNTKYPERAIALLDYLKSKHTEMMLLFGPREGQDWNVDTDGYPRWTEEGAKIISNRDKAEMKKIGISQFTYTRNGIMAYFLDRTPAEPTDAAKKTAQYLKLAGKYYKDFTDITMAGMGSYPPGSEEEKISTTIKDYFGREVIKIAAGKPENVESAYAKLLETIKGMGLDKLNAYNTNLAENLSAKLKSLGY